MMDFYSLDCLGADPTLDDVAMGRHALKRGSKGAAVRYVQEHLGFTGGDVDGDFGEQTEKRVREFQIANGLQPVDGEVSKNTMAALDAMVMRGQKFSPAPASAPVVSVPQSAARPAVSAQSPAAIKAPPANSIAVASEPGTPFSTYAAYGLGGLAAAGLGYAILKG